MTLPTPDQFPTWCEVDQVDPVSNQNNAVEPVEELKQFGFPFKAYPVRNFLNYIFRWTSRWISYLAQNDTYAQTTVITGDYGEDYVICEPGRRAVLLIYVVDIRNDGMGGDSDSYFSGLVSAFSPTGSDRAINIIGSNHLTLSTLNHLTGVVRVTTSTGSPGPFQLVAVQYKAGS